MRVAYWEWSNGSVVTSEGLGKLAETLRWRLFFWLNSK